MSPNPEQRVLADIDALIQRQVDESLMHGPTDNYDRGVLSRSYGRDNYEIESCEVCGKEWHGKSVPGGCPGPWGSDKDKRKYVAKKSGDTYPGAGTSVVPDTAEAARESLVENIRGQALAHFSGWIMEALFSDPEITLDSRLARIRDVVYEMCRVRSRRIRRAIWDDLRTMLECFGE